MEDKPTHERDCASRLDRNAKCDCARGEQRRIKALAVKTITRRAKTMKRCEWLERLVRGDDQ